MFRGRVVILLLMDHCALLFLKRFIPVLSAFFHFWLQSTRCDPEHELSAYQYKGFDKTHTRSSAISPISCHVQQGIEGAFQFLHFNERGGQAQ